MSNMAGKKGDMINHHHTLNLKILQFDGKRRIFVTYFNSWCKMKTKLYGNISLPFLIRHVPISFDLCIETHKNKNQIKLSWQYKKLNFLI